MKLPASIGADGQEVLARGCYHRLKGRTEEADEHFKPYVPAEFKPAEPKGGRSAYAKVALIAGRIRMQAAAKRRQQRLQRRVEARESLDRLINTFGADGLSDDGAEGVSQGGVEGGMITEDSVEDGSGGEFWSTVGDTEACGRSFNKML